ncbi:uncharacterized protein LDX57_004964 [Aspergillus melleus]|uniref:uncharacterized protein n=1 Tax=Aspergillus melleus TaxID=138277 RepID=UPI001E8D5B61|nr:uncharacterized protein LDX57_004964 [Aspergillus melleus]KAH8427251.1 hypothetical protein LDX57_004964 [Aspergillus melleus]
MDGVGLALTIVSLYSTCRDCYIFYNDVKNGPRSAIRLVREMGIQEFILKSWGSYWEISRHSTVIGPSSKQIGPQTHDKLARYLERTPYKAEGLGNALCLIADTLSNKEILESTYGLKLEPEKHQDTNRYSKLEEIPTSPEAAMKKLKAHQALLRSRMGIFKRCKWAFTGREKVNDFLSDLKKYNDSLYMLCPDGAFEIMQINFVVDYLTSHNSITILKKLETSSREASKAGALAPSQQGLQVLNEVASLKIMKLHSSHNVGEEEARLFFTIKDTDLSMDKEQESGLALWTCWSDNYSRCEAVYVERKSYRCEQGKVDKLIRQDILKLGRLFKNPNCAAMLHSLQCIGLVDYPASKEIGLEFRLPQGMGKSSPGFPAGDLAARRPKSSGGASAPALGWRFGIAKDLVRSIAFLHSCGWLHKNISSSGSVLLFRNMQVRQIGSYKRFDYTAAFMGYFFSRPNLEANATPTSSSRKFPDPEEPTTDSEESVIDPRLAEEHILIYEDSKQRIMDTEEPNTNFEEPPNPAQVSHRRHQICLDEHHHPAKRANRDRVYCHAFDIYSLGIVLLEIGLWPFIGELNIPDIDPYAARREILDVHVPLLANQCGELYERMVRDCLSVEPPETAAEASEQTRLCATIAARLAECKA